MNPSSDVGNPGTSINFDAGAFHEAEEAEYHREEQERQNELRELLTNALDLTEDEDEDDSEENMSHQSQDMNRPQEWSDQDEREPPAGSQEGENWDNFPVATVSNNVQSQSPPFQQMSPRPIGGTKLVPPAAFTYTGSHQGEFSHHPVDYSPHPQYNLGVSDPYHDYNAATQWSDDHAHQYHDYGERGEIEGGNDQEYHHHHYQDDKGEAQGLYYHHQKFVPERDNHNVYHGKRDIFDDNSYSELERDRVYHGDSYSDIPTDGVIKAHDTNYISTPQAIIPTHDTDASDSYKVSYHPPQLLPVHLDNERILSSEKPRPPPLPRDGPGAPDPAQQPRPTTPGEEERLQADFLNATDGGADTRHMTQLEILYRARGKQLEEVSEQLKVLQDDSAREARILKHKLALTEDERDGLKVSLDQNAALLSIGKKNEAELQGKITALESQIEALQAGKQELMKKLSSAESTIESVNQQLADLGASESLSRSREQHEAVVASLNQRHQQQVYMLNEKLDSLSHDNEAKSDEIGSLKRQLAEAVTRSEQATVERADTINRLTRSLEDSQSQIECLLEAGTGKAAAALKVQLQEVIAGKSIAEDLNAALQDEIRDLKEQVTMYESVSHLGVTFSSTVTATSGPPGVDDSYAQLGIRPAGGDLHHQHHTWGDTPATAKKSEFGDTSISTPEQTSVHGLKTELERCLLMYKGKREAVTKLQVELRDVKTDLDSANSHIESLQNEVKALKTKLKDYSEISEKGLGSVEEAKLQRELDKLIKERDKLLHELEDTRQRLSEAADSEEQATELNQELNRRMAAMIAEFDEDKRLALQKCQETLLAHHEASKKILEENLREEFKKEAEEAQEAIDEDLQSARQSVEASQSELTQVKELYVAVCAEKDELEDRLKADYEQKLDEELKDMKEQLEKEQEEELERVRASLDADLRASVAEEREKWSQDQLREHALALEAKIAEAKIVWFEEHKEAKEKAIAVAVKTREDELEAEAERRLEEELVAAVEAARADWERSAGSRDKEVSVQINAALTSAKDEWEKEKEKALADVEQMLVKEKTIALDTLKKEMEEIVSRLEQEKSEAMQALKDKEESIRKLEEERQEAIERIKSKLEEKERLLEESQLQQTTNVEEEIKRVRSELELELQSARSESNEALLQQITNLKQEITKLQEEKSALESEKALLESSAATSASQWQREKITLLRAKDEEKRKEVQEIQDQCEEDYKLFLKEHQETLNKALKAARDTFNQDKDQEIDIAAELIEKYEIALHQAQTQAIKDAQFANSFSKERVEMEEDFKQKLESMKAMYEDEKEQLTIAHRKNLAEALEEAKERWAKKESKQPSSSCPGGEWESERQRLVSEVEQRDALLQIADAHMEAEIEKLQDQLTEQHARQVQQEVQIQSDKMEKEYQSRIAELIDDKVQVSNKLETTRGLLQDLEQKYRKDTGNLTEKMKQVKQELNRVRHELEQKLAVLQELEAQKNQLELSLTEARQRVSVTENQMADVIARQEKAEKQRQEVVETYKRSEAEHAEIVNSYKQRHNELNEKIQKLERQVRSADQRIRAHVKAAQEAMEQEHSVAMDNMKAKMVELRNSHVSAMESLRKDHSGEKQRWKKQMAVVQQQNQRQTMHTPTQTERDEIEKSALCELREQYVAAVNKMRDDVMKHVTDSNEKASETVRLEVIKERQKTAKRLRKYYMRCLAQMLNKDYDSHTASQRLAAMEHALDSVPERDSSSQASTTASSCSTPSVPLSTTPGGHGAALGGETTSSTASIAGDFNIEGKDEDAEKAESNGERWLTPREAVADELITPPSEGTAATTDYGYYSRSSEPRSYNTSARVKQAEMRSHRGGGGSSSGGTNSPLQHTIDDEFFVTAGNNSHSNNFYNLGGNWRKHLLSQNGVDSENVRSSRSDDPALVNNKGHKRTSFGCVTEYGIKGNTTVNNYRLQSEPSLSEASSTNSNKPLDASQRNSTGTAGNTRQNALYCKSVESFSLFSDNSSGKPQGGKYRYTSIRNTLATASPKSQNVLKSKSEADLMDAHDSIKDYFMDTQNPELTEEIFGTIPQKAPLYNPPPEKDSDSSNFSSRDSTPVAFSSRGGGSHVTVRDQKSSSQTTPLHQMVNQSSQVAHQNTRMHTTPMAAHHQPLYSTFPMETASPQYVKHSQSESLYNANINHQQQAYKTHTSATTSKTKTQSAIFRPLPVSTSAKTGVLMSPGRGQVAATNHEVMKPIPVMARTAQQTAIEGNVASPGTARNAYR